MRLHELVPVGVEIPDQVLGLQIDLQPLEIVLAEEIHVGGGERAGCHRLLALVRGQGIFGKPAQRGVFVAEAFLGDDRVVPVARLEDLGGVVVLQPFQERGGDAPTPHRERDLRA